MAEHTDAPSPQIRLDLAGVRMGDRQVEKVVLSPPDERCTVERRRDRIAVRADETAGSEDEVAGSGFGAIWVPLPHPATRGTVAARPSACRRSRFTMVASLSSSAEQGLEELAGEALGRLGDQLGRPLGDHLTAAEKLSLAASPYSSAKALIGAQKIESPASRMRSRSPSS